MNFEVVFDDDDTVSVSLYGTIIYSEPKGNTFHFEDLTAFQKRFAERLAQALAWAHPPFKEPS